MSEFSKAQQHLSDASKTLEFFLDFFKFYKSINDETATKILDYIENIEITERSKSVHHSIESLLALMKSKANFHQETSQ